MKQITVTTDSKEKDTKVPEGTIQVIQKGNKEVLTTNKIPENAKVNSYKPEFKEKKEGATKTNKSEEKILSKVTDKTTKGSRSNDTKDVKTNEINEKDKKVPEGSIQVIQKGSKEVLTTNKIPENALGNTYKPDVKEKEGAKNANKSEEKQPSKSTDKTKGSSFEETNDLKANHTNEKDKKVPESSIQVIRKGGKEVLTNKIPGNAIVNTYKPDIKETKKETTTTNTTEKKLASKATDKLAKGYDLKDTNDTTANQTKTQSTKVCLFSELSELAQKERNLILTRESECKFPSLSNGRTYFPSEG